MKGNIIILLKTKMIFEYIQNFDILFFSDKKNF